MVDVKKIEEGYDKGKLLYFALLAARADEARVNDELAKDTEAEKRRYSAAVGELDVRRKAARFVTDEAQQALDAHIEALHRDLGVVIQFEAKVVSNGSTRL